jgi:hypothetical protein
MAKKEATVNAATDKLAALTIGESAQLGALTYNRVPGGYVAICGNVAAFVPLTELACAELGIEFTDISSE